MIDDNDNNKYFNNKYYNKNNIISASPNRFRVCGESFRSFAKTTATTTTIILMCPTETVL
jgi:hypothetical protein